MPATCDIVAASLNLLGTIVLALDPMFAGRRVAAAAGWSKLSGVLAKKGVNPPAEVGKDGKPVRGAGQQEVQAAVQAGHRARWGLGLIALGFLVQLLAAFYKTDCTPR